MPPFPSSAPPLALAYDHVRTRTEELAEPLSAEDQQVQSMPDVSPTKWHRAHTTWFFEEFVLRPHLAGYDDFDPRFGFLFNSYYEGVGPRHARSERGLITRPGIEEVAAYRRHVDAAMADLLASDALDRPDLAALVELGLHHEQQHQELLLMDVKHVLWTNPYRPAYAERVSPSPGSPPSLGWVGFDGGIVEIGHDGSGFAFDNEAPRHRTLLEPYRLADRLVTCGEWLEFMADDGYHDPRWWLSAGWATVQQQGWVAPEYWEASESGWRVFTLAGSRPVDPAEPVVHVSYYEADAFARWADARLPTEFEWEHAAVTAGPVGDTPNLADRRIHHPTPADPSASGLRQSVGDVWEWTASSYAPYPRFRAPEGAVGEYNGKFMVDQYVLRGGCCVTPEGHVRPTYRNFFPSGSRWMFGGVRLAQDAA